MATELNTMKRGQPVIVSQKGEKIEKVLHFGAFWCVACASVFGAPQQVVFAHSLEGRATGENAKFVAFCCIDLHMAGGAEKISKSDAKRCILMHGERVTCRIRRISGVGISNDASFADQKMVRLMHCVA